MARQDLPPKTSRLLMLASIILVIASLYLAQEVLVPLALATLFSFLLAPLVYRLERLKAPRGVAVLVTVLFAFTILGGIGYVVYNQMDDLARRLPQYRENIQTKVNSIRSGGGFFKNVKKAGEEVQHILAPPATAPSTQATQPTAAERSGQSPVPVVVTNRPPEPPSEAPAPPAGQKQSPFGLISDIGGTIFGVVGTAFIVIIFTIFMLLQREDLRDRLIRLIGRGQLTVTTEALDDAAARVSRYLLMQSIINGGVGVTVMVMLWTIGKWNGLPFPSPALFGLLSGLLRFVPYVGIWVAAAFPLLLSLAVYSTAKVALETLGAYLLMEVIAANVFEPLLFGSSTGITTIAVLVAAAFWTWLWGPVGLILSTPMTVCVVVIGKYVPGLSFLNILLADEPALAPPDRVYQRLLATDEEEAERLVDEYARTMPLEELYDTVLVPALGMAERDRHAGNLDEERHTQIRRGMREIIEDLGDRHRTEVLRLAAQKTVDQARGDAPGNADASVAAGNGNGKKSDPAFEPTMAQPPAEERPMLPQGCVINVVCLPAIDESDELAAMMFAQLLDIRGYCAKAVSVEKLASEMVEIVQQAKADLVCVSALPPTASRHARYLCKRLHAALPGLELVVGLWTARGDMKSAKQRIACAEPVRVVATLKDALAEVHQLVQPKLIERGENLPSPPKSEDKPAIAGTRG